jgi:hypothetical protein
MTYKPASELKVGDNVYGVHDDKIFIDKITSIRNCYWSSKERGIMLEFQNQPGSSTTTLYSTRVGLFGIYFTTYEEAKENHLRYLLGEYQKAADSLNTFQKNIVEDFGDYPL